MTEVEVFVTADGSNSLRNNRLNETYHSVHGAIQESTHVFVHHGLNFYCQQHSAPTIEILEVGFGTGLNALLTLEYAIRKKTSINYTSLESDPLDESTSLFLNYPALISLDNIGSMFEQLHCSPWDQAQMIHDSFALSKKRTRLEDYPAPPLQFDIIYFDAFAPSKQPELWELPMLRKIERAMKSGAIFVTYCAKGQLKRDLRSLGLQVETLAGPPGKKEMVRATKS